MSSCFKSIIQTYCHYAWTYLDEKSETEDAVQDVFIYIWNNRETIRLQESFRGIFFCRQTPGIEYFETSVCRTNSFRLLSEYWDDLLKIRYSEEEQTQLEQIQHILQSLPQKCRIVFMKSCLEGKKYLEIAEELRISVNTGNHISPKAYREIREKIAVLKNSNLLLLIACATYKDESNFFLFHSPVF